MKKGVKTPLELGKRERQIYETVLSLGEASVTEVMENLAKAPSYSAVRATMNLLVEKKWLRFRQVGAKYLYRASADLEKIQRSAIARLLSTFFGGSPTQAVATLLDVSSANLSDEQWQDLMAMLEKARSEQNKNP